MVAKWCTSPAFSCSRGFTRRTAGLGKWAIKKMGLHLHKIFQFRQSTFLTSQKRQHSPNRNEVKSTREPCRYNLLINAMNPRVVQLQGSVLGLRVKAFPDSRIWG